MPSFSATAAPSNQALNRTPKSWFLFNVTGKFQRPVFFYTVHLAPVTAALYVMKNQLTKGETRRVMYIENKDGEIDGVAARIGWVEFSKSGRSVYYRGKTLQRAKGGGIMGNFFDAKTGEEYWISGIKKRGSNVHWAEPAAVSVDKDAIKEYKRIKTKNGI